MNKILLSPLLSPWIFSVKLKGLLMSAASGSVVWVCRGRGVGGFSPPLSDSEALHFPLHGFSCACINWLYWYCILQPVYKLNTLPLFH